MIVFCLGTKGSGSTWIFNVVRAIAAHCGKDSVSFFSEDIEGFVRNFEPVTGFTVVKCHFIEPRLLDLAQLLGAKVIISDRDPRDCAVSVRERFRLDIDAIIRDLSRSYSSILSLPPEIPVFRVRYGGSIGAEAARVREIAEFLECDLPQHVIDSIALEFSYGLVFERVRSIPCHGDPAVSFEPDTHWHPNHLGDGEVGKWQDRLEPAHARKLEAAILPMGLADGPDRLTLFWPASAFHLGEHVEHEGSVVISTSGVEQCLAWGPYLHLPPGRWSTEFLIERGKDDLTIKIDVHDLVPHRGVLCLKRIEPGRTGPLDRTLEFDHLDAAACLETRVFAVGDGRPGRLVFSGVRLRRIEPLPRQRQNSVNRIKACTALLPDCR